MSESYRLNTELAQKIVANIMTASGAGANVIGTDGVIIASYDPTRVGSYHEGGHRMIIHDLDEHAISEEMAASMAGTKAGYIGSIRLGSQRLGLIGIRGDPEKVKPLQKMAELAAQEAILRDASARREREEIRAMEEEIVEIAENMRILAMNGSIQAAKLGERGQAFKVVVSEMRKLSERIQQIVGRRGA
ncbi:MAG TPA: sugar diacid recognition domain-containing protein [Spirochaetales bacterium]|nr:sugar diacid recognition domain-containing protein [Spirochaetales bacterium]HRY54183.1 sugar diacid recognition domain-containing protein [Spirochaetia bacterium]